MLWVATAQPLLDSRTQHRRKVGLLGDRPVGSMAIPQNLQPNSADIPVTVSADAQLPRFAYEAIKAHGLTGSPIPSEQQRRQCSNKHGIRQLPFGPV